MSGIIGGRRPKVKMTKTKDLQTPQTQEKNIEIDRTKCKGSTHPSNTTKNLNIFINKELRLLFLMLTKLEKLPSSIKTTIYKKRIPF